VNRAAALAGLMLLAGCSMMERPNGLVPEISTELQRTAERKPAAAPRIP
jgi:hypothetical protein